MVFDLFVICYSHNLKWSHCDRQSVCHTFLWLEFWGFEFKSKEYTAICSVIFVHILWLLHSFSKAILYWVLGLVSKWHLKKVKCHVYVQYLTLFPCWFWFCLFPVFWLANFWSMNRKLIIWWVLWPQVLVLKTSPPLKLNFWIKMKTYVHQPFRQAVIPQFYPPSVL